MSFHNMEPHWPICMYLLKSSSLPNHSPTFLSSTLETQLRCFFLLLALKPMHLGFFSFNLDLFIRSITPNQGGVCIKRAYIVIMCIEQKHSLDSIIYYIWLGFERLKCHPSCYLFVSQCSVDL